MSASVTIGILEARSIARGAEATDAMLKAAEVELVRAGVICPGKYLTIVSGEVAAVTASVEAGADRAGRACAGTCVLARLDGRVARALRGARFETGVDAVGVVECGTVETCVHAADAAVKAADVELVRLRLGGGIGGKGYLVLTGDVSAVSAAVEAASAVAADASRLIDAVVIARPEEALFQSL